MPGGSLLMLNDHSILIFYAFLLLSRSDFSEFCNTDHGPVSGGQDHLRFFIYTALSLLVAPFFLDKLPQLEAKMTFQAVPTEAGVYRVKVYNSGNDSYWRYMTDATPAWIKMTTLDSSNSAFKWNIAPVSGSSTEFTITPVDDSANGLVHSDTSANYYWGYGYPVAKKGSSSKWTIKKKYSSDNFSKIYVDCGSYPLDCYICDSNKSQAVHFYADQDRANQKWVFELVKPDPPPPTPTPSKSRKNFKELFFSYTAKEAAKLEYDIIVVGTGMGGGIVAGDFFDTNSKLGSGAKSVLVTWSTDNTTATGVVVKGSDGVEYTIKLKARGTGPSANAALPAVVLAAGSVASPAILMRSGLTDFLTQNGGLHLTDHDIFAKAYTFRYLNPADRDRVGSMKLQSYLRPRPGSPIALANIAIDASSFLPRGPVGNDRVNQTFPLLTAAYIRSRELSKTNTIKLDKDGEPIVTITRDPQTNDDKLDIAQIQDVTVKALEVIEDALPIEILNDNQGGDFFKYLELGGVAHELGTIPMPGAKKSSYCVDSNLKLRTKQGVYVCDLSVFPYSPEVNTSLTLAALALRLSRSIHPPSPELATSDDTVNVVNQTGDTISVFISNHAGTTGPNDRETLAPGAVMSRARKQGVSEAAFVYRLKYKSTTEFVKDPVLYIAEPGNLVLIE
ncbi:hypothetical protein DL93DRAFT_2101250 [Clavulina sp. PMI_390]|nr:hypothetical protein DL93DRAFT_2101250 [Clavulina sp. PMI_390]